MKWEEHLFASPLQSLEGCMQKGFMFVHVPKRGGHSNHLLVTEMTESKFVMSIQQNM